MHRLISFVLVFCTAASTVAQTGYTWVHGAIVRGDTSKKQLALVFTGDEFADGGAFISRTLKEHNTTASFFFTGRFYRNPAFKGLVQALKQDGHYLGAHSDQHLLYCDWGNRDSLLVTKKQFKKDLQRNYAAMRHFGIRKNKARYFLPPFEWYNATIAGWTGELGLQLINFSPGTLSHADYTTPEARNYRDSEAIFQSIVRFEKEKGLNGFILLLHVGTDPRRNDKFYHRLPELLLWLRSKNYQTVSINELLNIQRHAVYPIPF